MKEPIYISKNELWLWRNPGALSSVARGLKQAAKGEIVNIGSFAEYVDIKIED